MAGHIGLQRKLVQQSFAEGVDRLDLQTTRRFQRLGKQPPRLGDLHGIRLMTFDSRDPRAQLVVGENRPFRQPLKHTVRHFRRCGLCVGEAEDGGGTASGKQKPDYPLG